MAHHSHNTGNALNNHQIPLHTETLTSHQEEVHESCTLRFLKGGSSSVLNFESLVSPQLLLAIVKQMDHFMLRPPIPIKHGLEKGLFHFPRPKMFCIGYDIQCSTARHVVR